MTDYSGIWKTIFESLKGHTEAVLAATLIFAAFILLLANVNPWAATIFPASIYIIYFFRMLLHDKHRERMAEYDVKRLEKGKGIAVRNKGQKALSRQRNDNGKP